MPQHIKEPRGGMPTVWKVLIIVMAVLSSVTLFISVCTFGGVWDSIALLFSGESPSLPVIVPSATMTDAPQRDPIFKKPDHMKGVYLTPGVDYYTSPKDSVQDVKDQVDYAFEAMGEWQFNTVILPLCLEDGREAVYPTELMQSVSLSEEDGQAFDPITYILKKAREKGLYVYVVLDMHVQDGEIFDPRTEEGTALTLRIVTEIVKRYQADGFILDGYTFDSDDVKKEERDSAIAALNDLTVSVTELVRRQNQDLFIGLSAGIWAHKSVDERGSATAEYREDYTDGCANTLEWVEQGYFDFVMLRNNTSTSHPTASFQNVLRWWNSVAQSRSLPLYVMHDANRVGSYLAGWKATDQLAQQYLYCKDASEWKGSAFDSLHALSTDKTGAAEALKRAYDGTLDEQYIYKQLTLTFPTKTQYTTTESTVTLQGGGDKNFPLTLNGKEVELTEHGYFSLHQTLKVGVNTFTFTHKGTTKTYKITYKQTLLKNMSPSTDMMVDGGSAFIVSAVARKGSTVTATFNKKTITLKAGAIKEDEGGSGPSDFQEYKGTFTLPDGKVGQSVDLGTVAMKATYNGLSESKVGGRIRLNAKPVITTQPSETPDSSGNTPSGDNKIVTVTSAYAETFSGGDLIDDYSRPYNSYLPKGTKDYWVKTVYNGSFSYYLLASGRRVYCKDASLTSGGTLAKTALNNGTLTISSTHSVFSFDTEWKIPVYVRTRGQRYYLDSTKAEPNYGLERYSQTTSAVEITFHHLTTAPATPDVSTSPLFSSAKWVAEEQSGAYTLHLTLRKTGAFYGVSTKWSNNRLTITFLNPANVAGNAASEKLKGVRILIDPGHGSDNDKPWEAPFNLDYANTLKSKLEALGATVDMTRTAHLGKAELSLQSRVNIAQSKGYHLVISVHMNGANGRATGATVHYYSECSYTPSKYVYDKMHAVEVTYGVGTSTNGTPRASGTVWGTLYMTRSIFHCPSILLECAFLDNVHDKEALRDPIYRDKLMQATTDGVVQYFSAM